MDDIEERRMSKNSYAFTGKMVNDHFESFNVPEKIHYRMDYSESTRVAASHEESMRYQCLFP